MQDQATYGNATAGVSPVERVMRVFGSARATAIAGLTTGALIKWNRPLSKGGGGGLVPAKYQDRFLKAALAEGLPLTAGDFIAEPRP